MNHFSLHPVLQSTVCIHLHPSVDVFHHHTLAIIVDHMKRAQWDKPSNLWSIQSGSCDQVLHSYHPRNENCILSPLLRTPIATRYNFVSQADQDEDVSCDEWQRL